jgi:hypothetical protein
MKKNFLPLIGIVVVVIAGFVVYTLWQTRWHARPSAPVTVAPAAPSSVPPPAHYPIEQAQQPAAEQAPAAAPPLPPLDQSDAAFQDALSPVIGQQALQDNLRSEDMIRRLVATADNLTRENIAPRVRAFKDVPGHFEVRRENDEIFLSPENYARYTPFVQMAENLDTQKLVGVYVRFYPLIDEAYHKLGYPKGYFNDRLIQVIDDLLAAPDVQGPIKLVQPNVVYKYADPNLEALSAGQKIMVRIGPANAATVKRKLRELRKALTGNKLEQPSSH